MILDTLKYDMLADIGYIVSDFDGVMTDNQVYVDESGKETVMVSRADGQGINMLKEIGIQVLILSTEENPVVTKRAEKLRVKCIQGVKEKALLLKEWAVENNIDLSKVAYIGNDVNDLEALKLCGVKIVPLDAYNEVKDIADYITSVKGGYGVIREIAGLIKERGK